MQEMKASVSGRIARPLAEVWEMVADPVRLGTWFVTGGASARLDAAGTVTWAFADFPGPFDVEVVEVEPLRRIVLRWDANDPGAAAAYRTTVTFAFEALDDGRTLVSVTEDGFAATPSGHEAAAGNTGGWMFFVTALKAWAEHGVVLRTGMFA